MWRLAASDVLQADFNRNNGENTSHRPTEPKPEPEPERQPDATTEPEPPEAAHALVSALPHLSPDLRRIPRGMHEELTRLVSRWLAAGHAPTTVRTHILRGLPDDGTPVHRPGGLPRYLLQDVPPVPVPSSAPATERPAPAGPSSRVAALRECEGDHVQATLFRPVGNETLCRRCLTPPSRKAIPCGLAATAPTSHDIGQGTARKQEERGSVYALLAHMPHRVDVEDN